LSSGNRDFFSELGVDADIRVIASGSKAVALMLGDELDIAEQEWQNKQK
jgi:hypothetical protein